MITITVILAIYAVLVLLVLADTQHQQNIQRQNFLHKDDDDKRDAA